MYNNNTDQDFITAGLVCGLGAGIVTSFAVGQGQDPFIALGITIFSAVCGVICHRFGII